jgi:phage terminase small subunit
MATAPDITAYSQLTDKQRAFVDALCLEPNISHTKAAEKAGYSKKSAHVEGNRQLRKAKVRQALGEQLYGVAPTSEEIALRWDRVGRATLDDFYTIEQYEESTTVQRPLAEQIAQLEKTIDFDEEYAVRAVELLGLVDEAKEDYLDKSQAAINRKRLRVLELQMELERDPTATYGVPGPPIIKERLVLDLVKAQKAGVLDLAHAIKPTQYGTAVELRDQDAALDKLARMAGAYEKDNEQSAAKITGVGITVRRVSEKGGTGGA